MARDWGEREGFAGGVEAEGVASVVLVVEEEVHGSPQDEVVVVGGLESEEEGVGEVVDLGWEEDDCVSFANICMKAAISRSAVAGGVCVGVGVGAEGGGTAVAAAGVGLSLEPEGAAVEDDEFQNQPMVMASELVLGWWML
jgi:hypothetical protein